MSGRTDYGKGDMYRKVDSKKWNIGWLRVFGVKCPDCKDVEPLCHACKTCGGIGYIEKPKRRKLK